MVPPHGRYRYQFRPGPAGSRWYHTHTMAGADLHRRTYTGQYGFFYIESGKDPGKYDQEHFLALRDWEPISGQRRMRTMRTKIPMCRSPRNRRECLDGSEWLRGGLSMSTINDKVMGGGPPIQVKRGIASYFIS